MTTHPKKSSAKKATVQSSITSYFTPNPKASGKRGGAPRRSTSGVLAPGKSTVTPKPTKKREKSLGSRSGGSDVEDAEIVELGTDDDEEEVFANPRPTKKSRRVIMDEDEDLFAPIGASSSCTEVLDEPGPSNAFRTPYTEGKFFHCQTPLIPPSSVTAMQSSPLSSPGPNEELRFTTPAPHRYPPDSFRDVIPSSQTQELPLLSSPLSASVSPVRPSAFCFPPPNAMFTPDRHESDDIIVPDSQVNSPEKLSPVKLSSLQVGTPSKSRQPDHSAPSPTSLRSSLTNTQQEGPGSIVPSSRTFLLTMSGGGPFARPPVPVPQWDLKSPSDEIIPSSQTQLMSPVRPRTWYGDNPETPTRQSPASKTQDTANSEREHWQIPHSRGPFQTAQPASSCHPPSSPSPSHPRGVFADPSPSSREGQPSQNLTALPFRDPSPTSTAYEPPATMRRRMGPFAPTQSEESLEHSSQNEMSSVVVVERLLGSQLSSVHSLHLSSTNDGPTDLPPSSPPLNESQPLSFVERSFPSQYTQLSEGDSFRPPTESFFDRLAAAETVESSEDEMDEGF